MQPTPDNIAKLTPAQRRAVIMLQQEMVITPITSHTIRSFNALSLYGLLEHVPGAGQRTYRLIPEWQQAKIPTDDLDLDLSQKGKPFLKPIVPDPPKPRINRPPAVYDNCLTGDALVDQILGTSSKKKHGK